MKKAKIVIDEIREENGLKFHYIEWSDHTEGKPHCSKQYIYGDES